MRLAAFTDLVGTALSNADARAALNASRARIVAAADTARHKIERDLHDGAQQRLVALSLQMRAARAAVPRTEGELVGRLDGLADGLTGALGELQEIARGIHPAALAKGGLAPALQALAKRSAVPVHVQVDVDRRLPERVELAAYYVVAEAVTNAAKHAGAGVIDVEATTIGNVLRVDVRDDGRGGADASRGSGLVGLAGGSRRSAGASLSTAHRAPAPASRSRYRSPDHATEVSVYFPTRCGPSRDAGVVETVEGVSSRSEPLVSACAPDRRGGFAGRPRRGLGGGVHRRWREPGTFAVRPHDRPDGWCALRRRAVAGRRSRPLASAIRSDPSRPPPSRSGRPA